MQGSNDWSGSSNHEFQENLHQAVIAGEVGRASRLHEGIKKYLAQHASSSSK